MEGTVAEYREEDVCPSPGEAEQSLRVLLPWVKNAVRSRSIRSNQAAPVEADVAVRRCAGPFAHTLGLVEKGMRATALCSAAGRPSIGPFQMFSGDAMEGELSMRHAPIRRPLIAAVVLAVSVACASPASEAGSGSEGPPKAQVPTIVDTSTGCPDADVLEPVLGRPPFQLVRHQAWRDGGWHCRYEPAARNPLGVRLDVFARAKDATMGKPGTASGLGALPEFGQEAVFHTSCPDDPGTGRLSAAFARKGGQPANTQELVLEAAGEVIHDCHRQLSLMKALVKVFYDHQIAPPAQG
ncbi:hypothetical protein [Streptomyces sp. cmx-4-9]|uniref:hypothetical protein n=1 Tax=Streptomyces sp. cmx-4-9 TaxID=2790941 RepID=UPI00397FDF72